MSARTLFGLIFAVVMLATTAFAEEQKRDERNNPKSPQYKEHADMSQAAAQARLSLPEACGEVLRVLIAEKRGNPAHFTDAVAQALHDCVKLYIRTERYWWRAYGLLRYPNLMNDAEKLSECRAIIARLTECAAKFNERWKFMMDALVGEDWKAARGGSGKGGRRGGRGR
ncbi:MAG: hypothetical protein HYW56_01450 [Candidatus Harrisonbacteria bacterium]|nr:hypothetical protein [Candidatus Harrisonbacteria bacterium]